MVGLPDHLLQELVLEDYAIRFLLYVYRDVDLFPPHLRQVLGELFPHLRVRQLLDFLYLCLYLEALHLVGWRAVLLSLSWGSCCRLYLPVIFTAVLHDPGGLGFIFVG